MVCLAEWGGSFMGCAPISACCAAYPMEKIYRIVSKVSLNNM